MALSLKQLMCVGKYLFIFEVVFGDMKITKNKSKFLVSLALSGTRSYRFSYMHITSCT
jgi:hypothetical protein